MMRWPAIAANAVGFMAQAVDAIEGLIGNTLLTFARNPGVAANLVQHPALLCDVIEEVLRFDAPIQNTRRWFAEATSVLGQTIPAADAVLVVLAAANRDPRANPDPDRFDPGRSPRRTLAFGEGAHACPGRVLATYIARAGIEALLERGVDPRSIDPNPEYRPLPHARIPLLGMQGSWTIHA